MERPLNWRDRKRIVDLYEGRLAQFGYDVRTIGWGSKSDQWLRFSNLCRGLDLAGLRILDVGCGFGDFVDFLNDRDVPNYEYVGVDISPGLVKEAQHRYGGPGRQFVAVDILEKSGADRFDVVLSSGALSVQVTDNVAFAKSMLTKMFQMSNGAVCVNFLSSYVDYQLPKNFHYKPEEIFTFGRSLTRWVSLYHDYPLYEFTIQMFHGPQLADKHHAFNGESDATSTE